MSGSGSFVVTWIGQVPPAGSGVFARRYDAAGAPLGDEFVVNTTYTSGIQAYSNVASDDAGNFIVSWTGYSSRWRSIREWRRRCSTGSALPSRATSSSTR